MPEDKDKDDKVVPFQRKEEHIKKLMLDRLESTADGLNNQQERLKALGNLVLDMVEEAVKGKTLTAYKAAVAYGKCVDSFVKVAQTQMGLYDRLAGTVGMYGEHLEENTEEGFDNPDDLVRKEAELLVYQLVKEQVERKNQTDAG